MGGSASLMSGALRSSGCLFLVFQPMARLPRLDLAGHLHLVTQRARAGNLAFVDHDDRRRYLGAMLESARESAVAVHAYALMDTEVLLLATPAETASLARFMQGLGRRYVKAFNHRHDRSGALWEGRYRTTVVDPADLLPCIRLVEQAPMRAGLAARTTDWPWSSAAHHAGRKADPLIIEHATYWQLGNTPFEREARFAREGAMLLTDQDAERLLQAARYGWPIGSDAFLQVLRRTTDRPVQRRRRGRPKQTAI